MEVSEFTLKLIIVLIPGAIASIIYEKLTIHKRKWSPFSFIAHSILFGGMCYLVQEAFCALFLEKGSYTQFWKNLPLKDIPFLTVFISTCLSIPIGFLGADIDNKKYVNRIGTWLGFSTKYGDENLYSYFLSSENISEIYLRDLTTNQTYQGMIVSYSETETTIELVLRDVKVYEYETSAHVYDAKSVYLSRPKDAISIEVF